MNSFLIERRFIQGFPMKTIAAVRISSTSNLRKCGSAILRCKRKHSSSTVTRALDLDKLITGPNKEKVDKAVKDVDQRFKSVSDLMRRKTEIIQGALAKQVSTAAEELLHQTELTAKQLRKESVRAKATLVLTAEQVAAQAAEVAKDELGRAAETAPEGIKELAETAIVAHSEEKAKGGAVIHDFCLGIPFGGLLAVGGLLWFGITGSLHALRFGTLLGGLLLAVSVRSLQMWQAGKSTTRYIIAQSGLALLVAVREFSRFVETNRIFPTLLTATVSAAMVLFFWYVIGAGGPPQKKQKPSVA